MPHLVLSSLTTDSLKFSIEGEAAHHWVRVLRIKAGDAININNGKGIRAEGRILHVDSAIPKADGEIVRILPDAVRFHRIHLYQGLPRGTKFDFVLEKATELGVDSVTPFFSDKNPVELDEGQEKKKHERWEKVVAAAAKQSGNAITPRVNPVLTFDQLLEESKKNFCLLLHPNPKNQSLKESIQGKILPIDINVIIGPESGFTDSEAQHLFDAGCDAIVLGARILRTETAGLTILSILNYELGLF